MKYEDMLAHILPVCPECPDGLAIDHAVKAARELCNRTLVWQYQTPTINSIADWGDYTLQIPADQELVRALLVEVDGTEYLVPRAVMGRQMARRADSTRVAAFTGPHDFSLSPPPNLAGMPIVVEVAVRPTLGAVDWPDDLAEHVTDIAEGAMATLLALPRKVWTDPLTAQLHANKFMQRLGTVAMKVSRGYGRSRQGASIAWF